MPIISILNPKGGSGKTTLSTNLARAAHQRGQSVLLVDSDPQGSARDWHAANEQNPIPLVALDRANNLRTIDRVGGSYDLVVIDGAAKLEDMLAAAIKVSDFVLIPVQPSPYDIWAASDLVELVKTRQEIADGKPGAAFVITRKIEGTKLGGDVAGALAEYGFPVFDAPIVQRQVYPQSSAEGLTVFDAGNDKATAEIERIFLEMMNAIAACSIGEVKNAANG